MRLCVFVVVILGVCATAARSHAQLPTTDHYVCYKITDPLKVAGIVDLDTSRLGLASGCKLGKAVELCVPTEKRVVNARSNATKAPIDPLDAVGLPAPGDRICYQVSCPKPQPPDQAMTDQFGSRTLTKLKANRVCTPAFAGAPVAFRGLKHFPVGSALLTVEGTAPADTLALKSEQPKIIDNKKGLLVSFQLGGGQGGYTSYFWQKEVFSDDPFTPEKLATGNAIRWQLVASLSGHPTTVATASTVDGGSEVALSASFPGSGLRTGKARCSNHETDKQAEDNATWLFEYRSAIMPVVYSGSITPGAASTDIQMSFTFGPDCVPVTSPSGATFLADHLEISATVPLALTGIESALIETDVPATLKLADEGVQ